MRKKPQPSEYFLGAILRGYHKELVQGGTVTPSAIWNQICMECICRPQGFITMFDWDTRKNAGNVNRIGTIMETIEAGMVPGLRLRNDAKSRAIVVEEQ